MLIISFIASLIIAYLTDLITRLIGYSLIILVPVIELFIVLHIVNKIMMKHPLKSLTAARIVGLTIGLTLYLTPHVIMYNHLKSIVIKEVIEDYNLSDINLTNINQVVGSIIDFNVIDYLNLRARLGVSIGRTLTSISNFGPVGFVIVELITMAILVLTPVLWLVNKASIPFSEKAGSYHKKLIAFPVKVSQGGKLIKSLKVNPSIKLVKELISKGPYIPNSKMNEPVMFINLLGLPEFNEYSISVGTNYVNHYYLITNREAMTLKRLIVKTLTRKH